MQKDLGDSKGEGLEVQKYNQTRRIGHWAISRGGKLTALDYGRPRMVERIVHRRKKQRNKIDGGTRACGSRKFRIISRL